MGILSNENECPAHHRVLRFFVLEAVLVLPLLKLPPGNSDTESIHLFIFLRLISYDCAFL